KLICLPCLFGMFQSAPMLKDLGGQDVNIMRTLHLLSCAPKTRSAGQMPGRSLSAGAFARPLLAAYANSESASIRPLTEPLPRLPALREAAARNRTRQPLPGLRRGYVIGNRGRLRELPPS